jgi:hypothetical protein
VRQLDPSEAHSPDPLETWVRADGSRSLTVTTRVDADRLQTLKFLFDVDGDAGTGDAVNGGADRLIMIAGTARAGKRLSCSAGTWTGTPKLSYGWKRSGKAIKGQTSSSYTVRKADRRKALTCSVTAKNAGGTRTATTRAIRIK